MDDEFDDDILDQLDEAELRRLEQQAVEGTQALPRTQLQQITRRGPGGQRTSGLPSTREHADQHQRSWPSQNPPSYREPAQQYRQDDSFYGHDPNPNPSVPSSDYGDYDGIEESEALLETIEHNVAAPQIAVQAPVQRYQAPTTTLGVNQQAEFSAVDESAIEFYHDPNDELLEHEPVLLDDPHTEGYSDDPDQAAHMQNQQAMMHADNSLVAELTNKVLQLQQHIAQLGQGLQYAQQEANARTGEAALMRDSNDAIQRESRRVVSNLNRRTAEERLKHRSELDASRQETAKLQDEVEFLKRELGEAHRKTKQMHSNARSGKQLASQLGSLEATREGNGGSQPRASTSSKNDSPSKKQRRSHSYAFRDGFDGDDDIMIVSQPHAEKSKSSKKSEEKRRKLAKEGAVLPASPGQAAGAPSVPDVVIDVALLERLSLQNEKADYINELGTYKAPNQDETISMTMLKHEFPSSPDTPFYSYFMHEVQILPSSSPLAFSVGVCKILLAMWSRCLEERYYSPLFLLMDLLSFTITRVQGMPCCEILPESVDVIQRTMAINYMATYKREYGKLVPDIDVEACLRLLNDIILAVKADEKHTKTFWRAMHADIYVLLLAVQPIDHIQRLLELLCFSVQKDSFGCIVSDAEDQAASEDSMLDLTTRLLAEAPRPRENGKPFGTYGKSEILAFRTNVCALLSCITKVHQNGNAVIMAHPNALPRLVNVLTEEINNFYDVVWLTGAQENALFINNAFHLIYRVLQSDKQGALKRFTSGIFRKQLLVIIARLAHSRDEAEEGLIEHEVVQAAFRFLEEMLMPEEADDLRAYFDDEGSEDGF